MKKIEDLKQAIIGAETIAIFVHRNPDGDAIGSMLSLGLGLEKIGKKVTLVSQDRLPSTYLSLPGAERIQKIAPDDLDLAIAVDCGAAKVLGDTFAFFKKAKRTASVDHHSFRQPFADIDLIDQQAAAVGELVYFLLWEMKIKIDAAIAENLLTSIIVETNSFRLPSVRSLTFEICAKLLKSGIDFSRLSDSIYWSKNKQTALLSSICMMRAQYLAGDRIIWSKVTLDDFKKANGKDEDLDAFANDMLMIKGVEIAVFFRAKDNNTLRVSLRSKGKHNIAAVAEEFGGGGHSDSAGCIIANEQSQIDNLLKTTKRLLI